jgi:hypothetical protein
MAIDPTRTTSRRAFLETGLMGFLVVSLLDTLMAGEAVPSSLAPILKTWLRGLHERCGDLRGGAIPATIWQSEVTALLEKAPLEDLLGLIDFDQMLATVPLPDDRATTRDPVFPPLAGLPDRTDYIRRIFLLGEDRAIVPHGHRNMVSGHLVIHGSLRVRHFERLRDEPEHLILRPTIDRESRPGSATTVSDFKDNVHWLVATSKVAATFDLIVPDLDPARPTEFMDYVDPRRAEPIGGGALRAPRLRADEVFRRYGNSGV